MHVESRNKKRSQNSGSETSWKTLFSTPKCT